MANATLEEELVEALRKRLAVIADRGLRESEPERHLAQLREASERIVALQERLPGNIHPQLRHYFEHCSYDKALAWLDEDGLTARTK